MPRDMRHHLPIEKPPPVGCAACKHAVHCGHKPDNADQLGQLASARARAVNPHRALRPATGALFEGNAKFALIVKLGGDNPMRLVRRPHPRDLTKARPAQAAPGTELGERFKQIGLARTIGPEQADMPPVEPQVELFIIAIIGQEQTGQRTHQAAPLDCPAVPYRLF